MQEYFKHIMPVLLLLMAFINSGTNAFATPYDSGYTWQRISEYDNGKVKGSVEGNPNTDQAGNPVWGYEWHESGSDDYSNTDMMVWGEPDRWSNGSYEMNVSKWDQNINFDSRTYMGNAPIIRWTNPLEEEIDISLSGSLRLYWYGADWVKGGWSNYLVGYPIDAQVTVGYYDASDDEITFLFDETLENPLGIEKKCTPPDYTDCAFLDIPLDYALTLDKGDSIFWSVEALGTVYNKNRWLTLADNKATITLAGINTPESVPEPSTMVLICAGLSGFAIAGHRKRKTA